MTKLTAVDGGKSATTRKRTAKKSAAKKTVSQAAADGTRRELLVAMQERIAKAVQNRNTPARDLAALSRRLLEISKEIDAIDEAARQEAREQDEVPDEEWDGSAI